MAKTTAVKKRMTIGTKILKMTNEYIDLLVADIEYTVDSFMFLICREVFMQYIVVCVCWLSTNLRE